VRSLCDAAGLSETDLARLVRRGYGKQWVGFWLLARLLFDHRLPVLAALRGWLAPAAGRVDEAALAALHPPLPPGEDAAVDVLIPTLGRPGPLRDVLDDLGRQTLPPRRVIVVDQGSDPRPAGDWPFELVFLSQPEPGACKARNAGLREARSDWVLLLDDDVRLRPGLISYLVRAAGAYNVEAVTAAVHLPGEIPVSSLPRPWPVFASGASLVSARALAAAGGFDERLEGGYGEDYEFGLRLRLAGTEVLYAPGEPVLHLKAPAGGFRERTHSLPWSGDPVPPRPAPPVLYSRRKHHTKSMQNGYRLFYTLKRLSRAPLYSWPRELRDLSRQWERAVWWAGRLGGEP
jgi:glycosyltransferase involved in cell wall biosynthesis